MINNKIIKLKKYLFLISILFLVLSFSHLVYYYTYSDAKLVPIKGGTISEGLIGNFPSLNPLKPLSGNNMYIVNLLYRSLLKYDINQDKIVGDLATCDISNLLSIECYLKDNIFWSNGEPITVDDVVKTYDIIKKTESNKIISGLLQDTQIEQKDNTITFKNSKKDVNFLNIFFQPILPASTLDSLGTDNLGGDFPTEGMIYSGNYKISSVSSDVTLGVTKIFLDKNEFNDEGNIGKLILKLFPNTNNLLQNKESINIFNDDDNIIGDSMPRLESYKYTLPQFVSLFINENNVSSLDLRTYIFNKINRENLIKLLGEGNFETVANPYLSKTSIDSEITNKNLEKIFSELGYVKKSKIVEKYISTNKQETSTGTITNTGTTTKKVEIPEIPKDEDLKIDKFQQDSKYIVDPSYVDKYNFITKDDILLEGNAGKNVEAVYINDYKLVNFTSGGDKFYYRLKESIGSIKQGENNYKIYFVENGKKVLKEEVNFLFYKDKSELENKTKEYIKKLYIAQQEELKKQNAQNEQKTQEIKKEEKVDKPEISTEDMQKLNSLDDKYYYNDKLESFSLNLYYLSSEKDLEQTANFIKNSLIEIGVDVELRPISITDLSKLLSEKDTYDMLLTGVNLGYFKYNIFPYFHSSQVKNGYNFSVVKKTSLDILLEELKSNFQTTEETSKIEEKVLDILKKEQVVKTLYTPKNNLLIDKNIKNIKFKDKFIYKTDRIEVLKNIYIKEEKIINFKNKGIFDFFSFLLKELND